MFRLNRCRYCQTAIKSPRINSGNISGSVAFSPSAGTCAQAIVIIGTIISPTPEPNPLFVTPMSVTPRKMTNHQMDTGGRILGAEGKR
jgi:hypothetical protein